MRGARRRLAPPSSSRTSATSEGRLSRPWLAGSVPRSETPVEPSKPGERFGVERSGPGALRLWLATSDRRRHRDLWSFSQSHRVTHREMRLSMAIVIARRSAHRLHALVEHLQRPLPGVGRAGRVVGPWARVVEEEEL